MEAAIGLARVGGEAGRAAVPALLAAVADRGHRDRLRAVEALGILGPDASPAVPALVRVMKENGAIGLGAAAALGRIGPPARESADELRRALDAPDPQIRARAAIALWEVGRDAETAVPVLVEALRGPTLRPGVVMARLPSVRTFTRTAAFPIPYQAVATSQAAVPAVPPSFRCEIIEALGRMGTRASRAVPAVREAAKEADAATRKAAIEALKAIDPDGAAREVAS
jgi:hypothetical protein